MSKKYEFVPGDEITIAPGRTVKRIRALVAIAAFGVVPGDLGGYVESENNLSQVSGNAWVSGNARVSGNAQVSGNAWVSGNAQVSGNAWVSGNAQVSGNARVSGNAEVSGDAWVSGNARVYGDARVSGNAEVSGNARVFGNGLIVWFTGVGSENGTLTVYASKKGGIEVTRGCFHGTIKQFLDASAAKHDDRVRLEYQMLIEVAISRIEAARQRIGAET